MEKKLFLFVLLVFVGTFSGYLWSMGELSVDSFPDQASVFVDNKYYGKTPILIRNLTDGIHEVMVIKAGERAYVDKVQVYPNDRNKVMVDFTSTSKYGRKTLDNRDELDDTASESANTQSDYERRKERSKVRMRNTILGLGVLNEVMTKHHRTRRNVRKVLGGLEILNELGAFGTIMSPK